MRKMFRLSAVLCLLAFVIVAGGCAGASGRRCLGFNTSDFTILEENDSHGGFHGDGTYTVTLDCSGNHEKAEKVIADWKELPMSENVYEFVYGGGYGISETGNIPEIESGYYCFYDEQSSDHSDDSDLFNRYSFNVKVGIYDIETDRLYYVEFDT